MLPPPLPKNHHQTETSKQFSSKQFLRGLSNFGLLRIHLCTEIAKLKTIQYTPFCYFHEVSIYFIVHHAVFVVNFGFNGFPDQRERVKQDAVVYEWKSKGSRWWTPTRAKESTEPFVTPARKCNFFDIKTAIAILAKQLFRKLDTNQMKFSSTANEISLEACRTKSNVLEISSKATLSSRK